MRNSWVSMGANQNNQVQMLWQIKDEKLVCWLVGVWVGGEGAIKSLPLLLCSFSLSNLQQSWISI